jgi:hypothetical protein
MSKRYLKTGGLIGYQLATLDEGTAVLRDLVLDLREWVVRYLSVEADAWTPGHEVLVVPRAVTEIDEVTGTIGVELTIEQLRNSPALAAGSPILRDFEENIYRYSGWEDYWSSEIDPETAEAPPLATGPPTEEPRPGEANADAPGLIRLEELLTWAGETSDGWPIRPIEILLDDTDWTLPYLEILVSAGDGSNPEHLLLRTTLVAWADPEAQRLYLAVEAAELKDAPSKPSPAAGEEDRKIRILDT